MRSLLILLITTLIFFSCKKEKIYFPFTEKQLVFVNYEEGQNLKFIDSASTIQTLRQDEFRREFHEEVGFYGRTGKLAEEYEVSYQPQGNGDLFMDISLHRRMPYSLNLAFASYETFASPDSLNYSFPALTVNGKVYTEVYTLKMYKNGQFINNTDTATLFHNKQFGVIQLLFPDGKKIVRAD